MCGCVSSSLYAHSVGAGLHMVFCEPVLDPSFLPVCCSALLGPLFAVWVAQAPTQLHSSCLLPRSNYTGLKLCPTDSCPLPRGWLCFHLPERPAYQGMVSKNSCGLTSALYLVLASKADQPTSTPLRNCRCSQSLRSLQGSSPSVSHPKLALTLLPTPTSTSYTR